MVGSPDGIVMAVRDGVVRVAHAGQRTTGGAEDRKNERAIPGGIEVKAGQFKAIPLKRDLVIWLRHGLRCRHRPDGRQRHFGGEACAMNPQGKPGQHTRVATHGTSEP